MDWNSTTSISAIILTAIFAGIGYLVRINRERKRAFSITLFNMLEIWYQIRLLTAFNPNEFVGAYIAAIKKQIPGTELNDTDIEQIREVAVQVLSSMQAVHNNESIEKLFNSSIVSLSEFDPLLAYRLSANAPLKSAITFIKNYFKELNEAAEKEITKNELEALSYTSKKICEFINKDLIKDLESDLLLLSFKVSTIVFIKTLYKVKIKKHKTNIDINSLVADFITPFVNDISNQPFSSDVQEDQ